MSNYNQWVRRAVLATVIATPASAFAAMDWGVGADAGLQYESNPTKVDHDENSDVKNVDQINAFISRDGVHNRLEARYEARHENWFDNSLSDRNTLTGYGAFNWQPTDYFSWYVNNERRDLVVDNTEADVSSNRNVRSKLGTGVQLQAWLTHVDAIGVEPVYQRVSFQESTGADSTRPGATLFWRHLLSDVSTLSINAFGEKIKFDDSNTNSDIKRQNVYVGYSAALSRLQYTVNLGYTWTNPDVGESVNSPLLRFNADYSYQNQAVKLFATHVVTDNSIGLDESGIGGLSFNPGDTNIEQFDVVTRDQVFLSYHITLPSQRWDLGATYRYDKQNFDKLANDERRNSVRFTVGYQFNQAVRVGGFGEYERRDFLSSPNSYSDDIYRYGLSVDFQVLRNVALTFGASRDQRDSGRAGSDYADNIAYARIRLTFP